jgi:hypothetical protein
LRHLGRVGKSGRKLVLFLKFTLGNSMKIRWALNFFYI